jgi:hypothetical protein
MNEMALGVWDFFKISGVVVGLVVSTPITCCAELQGTETSLGRLSSRYGMDNDGEVENARSNLIKKWANEQ